MLILASQSSARQALLRQAGVAFSVQTAQVDERAVEAEILADGGTPEDVALALAGAKARGVSERQPGAFVVGADQTLALDGTTLHKPQTLESARRQLDRLRGRTHRLHSAVALAHDAEVIWSRLLSAELTMRDFTHAERDLVIDLEGEAILSSVGAYRLEGASIRLFDAVQGDYFAILGLPLLDLLAALREHAPDEISKAGR
jgi:septum formation protein